jgi:tetratricopeptide (TPR) repeat protein
MAAASLCMLSACDVDLTSAPQRSLDNYTMAAMAHQNGDDDTAIANLNVAIKENPELAQAHVLLGDIYRSRTDYTKAAEQYETAVKLNPEEFTSRYELALSYQLLNRLQDAVGSYLRALNLKPKDLNATMNLGLVYLALNQKDVAETCMRNAVAIDPQSALAYCNLGVVLDGRSDYPGAELEYRRAMELDDKNPVILMNLADNLIHQDRDEAVGVMQLAIKLSDTTAARKRYGDALVLGRRDDDAYRQYQEALRRNPSYWQAMNQAGMIQIRKYIAGATLNESQRLQAVDFWQKSLGLRPDQPAVQALVAKWWQGGKVTIGE